MNSMGETSGELVTRLSYAERGPQRNGIFALWLIVNACSGITGPNHLQDKNHKKRISALRKRLSSLSLPPQLRKVILPTLAELSDNGPDAAASVLAQLVEPVKESMGDECAKLIETASKRAHSTGDDEAKTETAGPTRKR